MANNTLDVCFSQKTENWGTPKDLFNQLNEEFHFTIDPCTFPSNPLGLPIFFTKEQDGLKQEWKGNAFVNPPYGKAARPFVEKAIEESTKHGTTNVLLLPARTDTRTFHDLIYNKENIEIRFIKGRVKFEGVSADYKRNSAPFPSMIVIVRPKTYKQLVKEAFAALEQDYGLAP